MRPLVVRPEAQADLIEARDWYTRQRQGLGDQFVDAVEEAIEQVRAVPESGQRGLTSQTTRDA